MGGSKVCIWVDYWVKLDGHLRLGDALLQVKNLGGLGGSSPINLMMCPWPK